MYVRVTQIKVPIAHTKQEVLREAVRIAGAAHGDVLSAQIERRSLDARRKDRIHYTCNCLLEMRDGARFKRSSRACVCRPVSFNPRLLKSSPPDKRIAVIGTGPAGLFAGYLLALNGCRPVLYERGRPVRERTEDVKRFFETGALDPESNVQFGEGGAGTFSDGKLATMVKDKQGRGPFVLETFVRFGAPDDILYEAKPHIGTDILIDVVENMRREIIRLGGEFHFSACVEDFLIADGRLIGLRINEKGKMITAAADAVILAPGHSARDTFQMLYNRQVPLCEKPFAVGFRIEHPQRMINVSQYGETHAGLLPPAFYKLTYKAAGGRGVYSFCMCPGGYVVNASSEEGHLAVNGMSRHARDAQNANSALVITLTPEDFGGEPLDPLRGMAYQGELERRAFALANGRIPQQLYADFKAGRCSLAYGAYSSCLCGSSAFANLRSLLPEELNTALIEAMEDFGRKITGFDREDAILSGIESRTSSPVRILRNDACESGIAGLYPCGEGAGYAGGITSAAMDGLKCAQAVLRSLYS